MDRNTEVEIKDVLRREQRNRIIAGVRCTFLECIGLLAQANVSQVKDYLQTILVNYSSRFKLALPLMHSQTPVQRTGVETDEDFRKRFDGYFERVIKDLGIVTKYVGIYLYAVATTLQIPIYVLMKEESRRLSWLYFPILFEVTSEEKLPSMSGRRYLTLFMHSSMDACLPITPKDRFARPPSAYGYIGMQNELLNDSSIDVPSEVLDTNINLQHHQQQMLVNLIDTDLVHTCSNIMFRTSIIDQNMNARFSAHYLGTGDKQQFVHQLVNSRGAYEVLCKYVIRNKKWDIWSVIFEDFGDELVIKDNSAELEASYITLCLAEDDLKRKLDLNKLRSWIGILKEQTKENFEINDDGILKEWFIYRLILSKTLYQQFCRILLLNREHDLLKLLGFSLRFRSAGTCLHLCKYVALKELEESVLRRGVRVDMLKLSCQSKSSEIEERRGVVNWLVIGGSTTGLAGGALAIAGLALSPCTAGLSLGLTIAGAAVGGVSGAVSGGARGIEAYKQIKSVNDAKEIQKEVSEMEINVQERLRLVESIFSQSGPSAKGGAEEEASADLRGFLAVGSAIRSAHGFITLGIAAARVGTTAAAVAASVFGPLSLIVDIGFLIEAGVNKKDGDKVSTAAQLRETGVVVEMKSRIMNSIWRGDFDTNTKILS